MSAFTEVNPDLRRMGSVDAYRAVKARGFRASKVLLYAIEERATGYPLE